MPRDQIAEPTGLVALAPGARRRSRRTTPLPWQDTTSTLRLEGLGKPSRGAKLALDAATGLLQEVPGRHVMSSTKIAAIALIVAGVLGLLYGSFSYTKDTQTAKVGALELSVKDRKTVNIPVWAGVAAVVAGGLMLVVPRRKG